jgi:hypothetical protein
MKEITTIITDLKLIRRKIIAAGEDLCIITLLSFAT